MKKNNKNGKRICKEFKYYPNKLTIFKLLTIHLRLIKNLGTHI